MLTHGTRGRDTPNRYHSAKPVAIAGLWKCFPAGALAFVTLSTLLLFPAQYCLLESLLPNKKTVGATHGNLHLPFCISYYRVGF